MEIIYGGARYVNDYYICADSFAFKRGASLDVSKAKAAPGEDLRATVRFQDAAGNPFDGSVSLAVFASWTVMLFVWLKPFPSATASLIFSKSVSSPIRSSGCAASPTPMICGSVNRAPIVAAPKNASPDSELILKAQKEPANIVEFDFKAPKTPGVYKVVMRAVDGWMRVSYAEAELAVE